MYDLDKMKEEIKCTDVCQKYGIALEWKNGRWWGKLRTEDDTPSFSIRSNNLWYDFGIAKGGSCIELVSHIEGISRNEAIKRLANMFNIPSEKSNEWQPLTDSQYTELGIYPDSAKMNINIDVTKFSPEIVKAWQNKYDISVSKLAAREPDTYKKLLWKKAIPVINNLKENYFHFSRQLKKESPDSLEYRLYYDKMKELEENINKKVSLLSKGMFNSSDFNNLKVNLMKTITKPITINDKTVLKPMSMNDNVVLNVGDMEINKKEILEMVKGHIDFLKSEGEFEGLEFEVVALDVYGSRAYGNFKESSDLDIVIEYKGEVREEDMFNTFNRVPLEINGVLVDINPITECKTGNIQEFLKRAEEYSKQKTQQKEGINNTKDNVEFNKEVGKIPYNVLKGQPGTNKFILINSSEFEKLQDSDLKYSAFKKGNMVNVAIKNSDTEKLLRTIDRKYEKTLGNIAYKELKMQGALVYKEYDDRTALHILHHAMKNNIQVSAFYKDPTNINIALKKADIEKFNNIAEKVIAALINRDKSKER